MEPDVLTDLQRQIRDLLLGGANIFRDGVDNVQEKLRHLAQRFETGSSATEAFTNVINDSVGKYALLAFRLTSVNSSVYGASDAFSSITPVIDATKEAFTKMTKFGSTVLSALPIGPLKAGVEKSLNLFTAGLDFAAESLKFYLEGAQKLTNAYIEMTKTGAYFGGSMAEFAKLSKDTNVPMIMLAKVTQANAENLAALGGTIADSSALIFQSSMKIFKENNKLSNQLVAMYGNFEDLSEGVADYFNLLSKTGVIVDQNIIDEKMKSGAVQEYLIRQKELSSILGKSTKAMKEAEEKRRSELDYATRVSRLANKDAADNLKSGMEIITKIFGQEAGDVAKEYFATGGNLYSESARKFQAAVPDAFNAIQAVVGNIDTNRATFEREVGGFLRQNEQAIISNAKANADLYSLNRGANNDFLRMVGVASSSVLASAGTIGKLPDVFEQLQPPARAFGEEGPGKPDLDAQTLAFVKSVRAVIERQTEMDAAVFKSMTDMDKITTKFLSLQSDMIKFQGEMFEKIRNIVGEIDVAGGNITAFSEKLGRLVLDKLREAGAFTEPTPTPAAPPPASTPTPAGAPPPSSDRSIGASSSSSPGRPGEGYAEGGITRGPSLAGEAGPEAVIPLSRGDVPLKIDWTPLVSAINNQVAVSMDIKSLLEDTKSIQENILDATY